MKIAKFEITVLETSYEIQFDQTKLEMLVFKGLYALIFKGYSEADLVTSAFEFAFTVRIRSLKK